MIASAALDASDAPTLAICISWRENFHDHGPQMIVVYQDYAEFFMDHLLIEDPLHQSLLKEMMSGPSPGRSFGDAVSEIVSDETALQ